MMSLEHLQATVVQLYRERRSPQRLKMLADMWWWGMLCVGVVLFLLAVGFSAFEFIRSREILSATAQNVATNPQPVLDRAGLQNAVRALDGRAALYSQMRDNLPTTTDPSL